VDATTLLGIGRPLGWVHSCPGVGNHPLHASLSTLVEANQIKGNQAVSGVPESVFPERGLAHRASSRPSFARGLLLTHTRPPRVCWCSRLAPRNCHNRVDCQITYPLFGRRASTRPHPPSLVAKLTGLDLPRAIVFLGDA
jgi:hypothetical protein